MECAKCKTELKEGSNFCPSCGEKLENQTEDLVRLYNQTSGCWFLLGMTYGTMKAKKDEDGIKEFEKNIRKNGAYDQYHNALTFAKNHISQSKLNTKGTQHPSNLNNVQ